MYYINIILMIKNKLLTKLVLLFCFMFLSNSQFFHLINQLVEDFFG